MTPVHLANRAAPSATLNEIARVRAALTAAGAELVDLSDSNPTRHGLLRPEVLDAVAEATGRCGRYHPTPRGDPVARGALAEYYGGDPDDYWLTASTSEAYAWLLTVLADPGEAVAVPVPGYPLVEPLARLSGVRTVDYSLHYLHPYGWTPDVAQLADRAADPTVRAVVVVNPGNPTGAYVCGPGQHGDAGSSVVAACRDGGAALIADEVFGPFALDGEPTTFGGESGVLTFTLGGLSKLLCAPQLKLGWIRLSGPAGETAAVREALDTVADTFLSVGAPVAAALPALLALAGGCVASTRERLATNLASARAVFDHGPYRLRRCEGGWTAIVDVPRYLSSQRLAVHLLRTAHLAVHPGWFYDLPDEGALALSLLPAPDAFAEGVRRLRAAVDALGR